MLRFLKKSKFLRPPQVDVAFFDRCGYEHFTENCLNFFKHVSIPCRQEEYWLSPTVLTRALMFLLTVARKRKKLKISLREVITVSYFAGIIQTINPKLIVTYIDNAKLFQVLMALFKNVRFVAVQNGARAYTSYKDMGFPNPIQYDVLLSFGEFEKRLLELIPIPVRECFPVGSFKLGNLDVASLKTAEPKYDLCLVSQVRKAFLDGDDERKIALAMQVLSEFLASFIKKKNLSLVVTLSSNEQWEIDFFSRFFAGVPNVTLQPNLIKGLTTYEVASASRVIVGQHSTVLLEMFGIGKKVLFCNTSACSFYDMAFDYEFALRRPSEKRFVSALEELLNMEPDEYRRRYEPLQRFLVSQDATRSPKKVLKDFIEMTLKEKYSSRPG